MNLFHFSHSRDVNFLLSFLHYGPRVLDKVVDEDRPGPVLVVVGHVRGDGLGKVEEEVPRVAGDGPLVVFLKKVLIVNMDFKVIGLFGASSVLVSYCQP